MMEAVADGRLGGTMKIKGSRAIALCGAAMLAMTVSGTAQQPAPQAQGGRGGGRGGVGPALFTAADTNKDAAVSREELKGTFDKWYAAADTANAGSITPAQLATVVTAALPAPPPPPQAQSEPCGGRSSNPQVPCAADVEKMKAALPSTAPAKPAKPHKILVYGHSTGFVHSSIPLAAATVDEMGKKLGTWTTTISYNPADINTENLKQYDVLFLDSTTGCFLDDPADQAATTARRAALLDFIRNGKGIAGIHAATDGYHGTPPGTPAPAAAAGPNAPQDGGVALWPDYIGLIGGYFKFHWLFPTQIAVKLDDPASPINAPFKQHAFSIADEIYTFNQDSFSRSRVH